MNFLENEAIRNCFLCMKSKPPPHSKKNTCGALHCLVALSALKCMKPLLTVVGFWGRASTLPGQCGPALERSRGVPSLHPAECHTPPCPGHSWGGWKNIEIILKL